MNCLIALPHNVIKTTLVFQQFSTRVPIFIQLIFGIIAQLQIISYLEEPAFTFQNKFTIILYFTRPHLYLFVDGSYQICFIILFLLIQIILIIWMYYSIILNSSSQKNIITSIQCLQQKFKKIKFLIYVISLYLFFNKVYIGNNIIEFCLLVILKDDGQSAILILVSIFLILEITIILFMQWQFVNRSIRLIPQLQYLIINQSNTSVINLFLKILQIVVFVATPNTNNALFGQAILVITNFMHKILQMQMNYLHMKNQHSFFLVVFSCQGLTLGILQLFASQYEDFHSRMWIILWPIVYLILRRVMQINLYQLLLYRSVETLSISQLKYLVCLVDSGIDLQKQENLILIYYLSNQNSYVSQHIIELNLKEINKKTVVIIQEMLINLIQKQYETITIKTKNTLKLQQIYLSYIQILIIQSKYIEAKQVIEQIKHFNIATNRMPKIGSKYNRLLIRVQLNWLQLIYMEILENKIQSNMQNKIISSCSKNRLDNSTISTAMRQVSTRNSNQINVQEIFENVIDLKIEYLNFVQSDNIKSGAFNQKTQNTLSKMESLRQQLKQNYKLFPTIQNQSILMVYQIEILNNILDAYQFSNTIAIDQDIILKHHQSEMFNFFNQSFNFIIFELHDIQNIQIKYHSINQNINYCIIEGEQLSSLVPRSLQYFHEKHVENFLQTGRNKFFQQIDETYISTSPGIIQPIDICMDLNYKNTSNLEILTVYRSSQVDDKQLILVDSNMKIIEVSCYLFQNILNLSYHQLHQIIGVPIYKVIPYFKRYIDEKVYDIKNCSIYFLNIAQDELDSKTKSKSQNAFEDFDLINNYSCHLLINIRKIDPEELYYIIRIDNLKQERQYSCSQFKLTQISEHQDFDEEIEINVPEIVEQQNIQILNTDRLETQLRLISDNQEYPINQDRKLTETSVVKFNVLNFKEDDRHSNISSIDLIKRSPNYKKFLMISEIINSKKKSKSLIIFNIAYIFYIALIVSHCLKALLVTYNLKEFISHINLLSIKNEVYHPIESFLLTRYTIVTYNSLLSSKIITQSEYSNLITFPNLDLLQDYDILKTSITKVLEIQDFQPFLEDNYVTVYLYEQTNIGKAYNITFRLAIHLLLNYQFDFKLGYTIKALQPDGPYFYYSYKNYIILFDKFLDLNNYTLKYTILLSQQKQKDVQFVIIIFCCFSFILILIKVYQQQQIKNLRDRILSLLKNQDCDQAQQEIKKLQQFKQCLMQNRAIVYEFQLDMQHIDKQVKERQQHFKQRSVNSKQSIQLNTNIRVLVIIVHFMLYFGLSLAFYLFTFNYLSRYENTAQYYQQVSNADIDVLIIYAQKEVLYYQTQFYYLNQTEINQLYDQINTSLASLQRFVTSLSNIAQVNALFGDTASETVTNITLKSICDNLSEDYKIRAQYICNDVFSGALTRGLLGSLSYMISSVKSEYESTKFMTRSSLPKLELEGATLVSNVLQSLVDSLKEEVEIITFAFQRNIYIIVSLFMFIEALSLYILVFSTKVQQLQLDLLKKFTYLMPAGTLFFDDQFSRNFKKMISYQQLT